MTTMELYESFRSEVVDALRDESVEDGMTHHAESIIEEAIKTENGTKWLDRLFNQYYDSNPAIASDILTLAGRINEEKIASLGYIMARKGLQHKDLQVRDGAICALEQWGGSEAVGILQDHNEPVEWLREYVVQVIEDLKE